jgi:hypothetical protein
MTPPEMVRIPVSIDAWQIRMVPNLWTPRTGHGPPATAQPDSSPFTEQPEVVIGSGRHDWDLRSARPDEVIAVLSAIPQRRRALAEPQPAAIIVFGNYGGWAARRSSHAHTQLGVARL